MSTAEKKIRPRWNTEGKSIERWLYLPRGGNVPFQEKEVEFSSWRLRVSRRSGITRGTRIRS